MPKQVNPPSAETFELKLKRLKFELGVLEDREVAVYLGLSPSALSLRKKRDSFPEDRLRALSKSQPELELDVGYVLTGQAGTKTIEKIERLFSESSLARSRLVARLHRASTLLPLDSLKLIATLADKLVEAGDAAQRSGGAATSADAVD